MQVEDRYASPGYNSDTMVKATTTKRSVDINGNPIKIKAATVGLPDSSAVQDGHQFVHFQVGAATCCVRFPVEALAPA